MDALCLPLPLAHGVGVSDAVADAYHFPVGLAHAYHFPVGLAYAYHFPVGLAHAYHFPVGLADAYCFPVCVPDGVHFSVRYPQPHPVAVGVADADYVSVCQRISVGFSGQAGVAWPLKRLLQWCLGFCGNQQPWGVGGGGGE